MIILALDTTSDYGSIALADGPGMLEEIELHSPEGFGHILFGEIDCLLKRHGLMLRDVEGYAAASGPGSFTGVRVGLTAVKGLAEANSRRVIAISNLQAVASFGSRPLRAPVIDARRGEIYGGLYDASLNPVREEVVTPFSSWVAALPDGGDLEIIANGLEIPAEVKFPLIHAPRALAAAIAKIASARFAAGVSADPADIDANYVRRSDAELLWRDK